MPYVKHYALKNIDDNILKISNDYSPKIMVRNFSIGFLFIGLALFIFFLILQISILKFINKIWPIWLIFIILPSIGLILSLILDQKSLLIDCINKKFTYSSKNINFIGPFSKVRFIIEKKFLEHSSIYEINIIAEDSKPFHTRQKIKKNKLGNYEFLLSGLSTGTEKEAEALVQYLKEFMSGEYLPDPNLSREKLKKFDNLV